MPSETRERPASCGTAWSPPGSIQRWFRSPGSSDGSATLIRVEFAEYVVLNAHRLWEEFRLELRRRMQKVRFPEGLAYDGEAFRTPVTCLFFRDLERSESEEYELVARTGFEPVTPALGMVSALRA